MPRVRSPHQFIFFACYGSGPHQCPVCDKLIYPFEVEEERWVVHHKDSDDSNNNPDNLEMVHATHHASRHGKGRKMTPEARANMSAVMYRRWADPEYRARVLPGMVAATHDGEAAIKRGKSITRIHAERRTKKCQA